MTGLQLPEVADVSPIEGSPAFSLFLISHIQISYFTSRGQVCVTHVLPLQLCPIFCRKAHSLLRWILVGGHSSHLSNSLGAEGCDSRVGIVGLLLGGAADSSRNGNSVGLVGVSRSVGGAVMGVDIKACGSRMMELGDDRPEVVDFRLCHVEQISLAARIKMSRRY